MGPITAAEVGATVRRTSQWPVSTGEGCHDSDGGGDGGLDGTREADTTTTLQVVGQDVLGPYLPGPCRMRFRFGERILHHHIDTALDDIALHDVSARHADHIGLPGHRICERRVRKCSVTRNGDPQAHRGREVAGGHCPSADGL